MIITYLMGFNLQILQLLDHKTYHGQSSVSMTTLSEKYFMNAVFPGVL